jgi:hypothetical protein
MGVERIVLTVCAHIFSDTRIATRVHPKENRVVLTLDGSPRGWAELDVFLGRAELVRLRDTLTATLAELDEKRVVLEQESAA